MDFDVSQRGGKNLVHIGIIQQVESLFGSFSFEIW
jgi:hypothetical protein